VRVTAEYEDGVDAVTKKLAGEISEAAGAIQAALCMAPDFEWPCPHCEGARRIGPPPWSKPELVEAGKSVRMRVKDEKPWQGPSGSVWSLAIGSLVREGVLEEDPRDWSLSEGPEFK